MSKPCGHTHVSVRDCKDCRIAELESVNEAFRTQSGRQLATILNLEQQLAELREGIAKHKDSFNNPDDYTGEDKELWELLQEKSK